MLPLALERFLRNFAVGFSTLLLDLALLTLATNVFGVPYYMATFGAFLFSVSVNYVVSRYVVFPGSERSWTRGFAYYAALSLFGAVATTVSVAFAVEYLAVHFIVARIFVSGCVGTINYIINLLYNFKVRGKPLRN